MIINEIIEVRIINHNINHYKDLGYDAKYGDIININCDKLSCGSHYKVQCQCDNCGKIKRMKFQDYYRITHGLKEDYFCSKCVKIYKNKPTLIKLYGKDNASKCEIFKNKRVETNKSKWGVENVFQNEIIKEKCLKTMYSKYGNIFTKTEEYINKSNETRSKKNAIIFESEKLDYNLYKKLVWKVTYHYKKVLFENWSGLDYYDNEKISENKTLDINDVNYPTIDHIISIFEGFKEKIHPEIIGGLKNLCITKRNNNSSKSKHLKKPKRLK